jgi:transcriptional regulator GlxA family with amidase domain
MKRQVALFLFDEVEVLDFAGPYEVFSVADELHDSSLFDVTIVAAEDRPVSARNGLSVNPDRTIHETASTDILVVPGGVGTRPLLEKQEVLDWIAGISGTATHVLSVCSGSLLLARAGLLRGLQATSHHRVLDKLADLSPETEVLRDVRFTDNGRILTSAGISAGIDMSLYLLENLCGRAVVDATAGYMEYRRA